MRLPIYKAISRGPITPFVTITGFITPFTTIIGSHLQASLDLGGPDAAAKAAAEAAEKAGVDAGGFGNVDDLGKVERCPTWEDSMMGSHDLVKR